MGYLDNKGLEHYSWLVRNKLAQNRQMTRTAPMVQFCPASQSELEPIVDFIFTETPPAEGEKGPENPSTITGVSQAKVTRCGKNLLLAVSDDSNFYGISITRQNDGSYLLNGTSTSGQERYFALTDCGRVSSGPYATLKLDTTKNYTLFARVISGTISGGASIAALSSANTNWIPGSAMSIADGGSVSITRSASSLVTGEFICRLNFSSGTSFNNVVLQVQLEEGSTATDFEAPMLPADTNYTIQLGDTYYGGSINFKTGVMTVTYFCDTITSLSSFSSVLTNTVKFRFSCTYYSAESSTNIVASNKFVCIRNTDDYEHIERNKGSAVSAAIYINKSRLDLSGAADPTNPTDAEWLAAGNAWVAENSFQFVAELRNAATVQLTPEQVLSLAQADPYVPQLNTVYSDQQAVCVGWQRIDIDSILSRLDAIEARLA